MAEAHATIFSREWWITVFLVGLGIHLLASYLKPRLDQIGGWFSRSWASRNEARAKERQIKIDALKRSRTAKANATTEEFRARLLSLQWIAFSIVGFLVIIVDALFPYRPKWDAAVFLIIAILLVFLGVNALAKGNNIHSEMLEAENQEREAAKKQLEAEMEKTLSELGLQGENGEPEG